MTHKNSTTIDDALEADFAEAWRPEAGDRLVGTVISLSERPGFEGRPYPIITIQPDEGEPLAVHAFHGVLMDELAKAAPKVDERLGIKYRGKVAGGERGYHSYRVAVDRVQGPIDWSTYSEDVPASEPLAEVPRSVSNLAPISIEPNLAPISIGRDVDLDTAASEQDDDGVPF